MSHRRMGWTTLWWGRASSPETIPEGASGSVEIDRGRWLWPSTVVLLGGGSTVALAGAGSGSLELALTGGAVAALALVLLMAADWLDPLAVLVLSLPLPALATAGDLRLAAAAPLTAIVVGAWFLAWGPSSRGLAAHRIPWAAGFALLAAQLLSALAGEHRGAAARELLNLGVLLALLVVAADLLARRPGRVRLVVHTVAVIAACCGGLAVLEAWRILPGRFPEAGGYNRAALGFGQPNGLGMFLAICLPLAVHAVGEGRTRMARWTARAGVLAVVAGLVATFSRGSWLSVLIGSLALALVGRRRLVARIWGLGLLALVAADLATAGAVREVVTGVLEDWSVAQRGALMLAGVRLFLENPALGVGPGGFAEEVEHLGVLVPTLWDLKPTPHNAYIQAAAETGLVGLVAFVAFLGVLLRRLITLVRLPTPHAREASLRGALLWSFSIALVEGLVEWPFSHGHGQLVVIVAAAGIALTPPPSPAETGEMR